MELKEIINAEECCTEAIYTSFVETSVKLERYKKILCSVSGGSDSDVVVDLCQKLDGADKITYVFFDTGLEFEATKEHIQFLEDKYGIEIKRAKAIKPIPTCCREYGQPFLSKQVSEWMARLQSHDFKWEDKSFDELLEEYPKCKAALRWWCNEFPNKDEKHFSRFNIAYNKYLKEFIIQNPPTFKISNKCCNYAKKKVAERERVSGQYDLSMFGVRKSEGGARASAYKTCFTSNEEKCDEFRPIFWYKEADKRAYEEAYKVEHSRCYTEYGMIRTGCAGCPYGRDFEGELEIMKNFEPNFYKAANSIFGDSYEYTRKYRAFVEAQKDNE